jgi:hypothetical protein
MGRLYTDYGFVWREEERIGRQAQEKKFQSRGTA